LKSLFIIFCCFCSVGAFAETGAQFTIPTKDGLSVLNGQYDIPTENTCGVGPYKTVLVVSGSGFVYRDGKMGYSENEADYLYKYMSKSFTSKCLMMVRWDYRGVSCDINSKADIDKCIDQSVRSKMGYESIKADIESVYNHVLNHRLVDKSNLIVLGHSEGSINTANLIKEQRINPSKLILMGSVTESPQSIIQWQMSTRHYEWLFEMDADKDDIVSNEEIESGFAKSKLTLLGKKESYLSPDGRWTRESFLRLVEKHYIDYANTVLTTDDSEIFKFGKIIFANYSYWKMWFSDRESVLEKLRNYEGKVTYINGDIDSQTPGFRQKKFLDDFKLVIKPEVKFYVIKDIGHAMGKHILLGPIEDTMVEELYKRIVE
jgi:pimeloyl-ACP methyl ester carboxylesterase